MPIFHSPAMLVLLVAALRATPAPHDGRDLVARVVGLEAEHQTLLSYPTGAIAAPGWTPPVLAQDRHLFSWRVKLWAGQIPGRNVTQVSSLLTLSTPGLWHRRTWVCSVALPPRGARPARYVATLEVLLRTNEDNATARATA